MRYTITVKADICKMVSVEAKNIEQAFQKASRQIIESDVTVSDNIKIGRMDLSKRPRVINPPKLSQRDLDLAIDDEAGYTFPEHRQL